MKRASAIVTNRGGRTCHAAIIARELGVPAVVGSAPPRSLKMASWSPSAALKAIPASSTKASWASSAPPPIWANMPPAPLKIMMNVANPERAFDFGQLPNAGIGLARLEMIIASHIGIHPNALLEYDRQDAATKKKIDEKIAGYGDPVSFYVDRLAEGIATSPRRLHRTSDRAPVGLQVQRVRQPDRRQQLRAARRESDDRLPRRQPLRRPELRPPSRWSVRPCCACATKWA